MSDQITVSEVAALDDAKLLGVAMRVVNTFRLSAEKAIAHGVDAAKYPLPADPKSLEEIVSARFKTLSGETQLKARTNVMKSVNASQAERSQVYKDLANVNLKTAAPVANLVKALPFPSNLKMSTNDLMNLGQTFEGQHSPSGLIQLQALNKVELRIHEVRCIDETNPEWLGDDEISMGGTSFLGGGATKKIQPFEVGDSFDDGEKKVYAPPRRFTSFSLNETADWPKSFFATLVLAEVDMGGLADFIDKLYDALKDEAVALIAGAIGGAIGSSGGPIGTVIGAVVGYVLGKVVEIITDWLGDEIFDPKTVAVHVGSPNATFSHGAATKKYVAEFKGDGGKYHVVYDWHLYA